MKDSSGPDFSFFNPNHQIKKDNMEVDSKEGMDGNKNGSTASGFNFGSGPSDDQSVFTFQPNSSASASTSTSKSNDSTRRRMIPPTSIPNFPSMDQPRDQPFSPSPSKSPVGAVFPFKSPSATPPNPPSLGTLPPAAFGGGVGGMPSPWLALAASSGAPTPSLDGPGRNSPQLGSPFEKLNIGGSWSGANLSDPLAGRRASLEPPSFSLSASPGKSSLSTEFSFGGAMDGQKSKSMDNSKKDRDQGMAIDAPEPKQKPALPATLAARRASLPRNHVNVHGPVISKTNSPLALSNITDAKPNTAQKAQPLAASSLGSMLGNPNVLVLDLRPPSSFQVAHLPKSHSLPIPSTLLRRPAFTIEKMVGMLHGDSVQAVSQWRNKTDIILIDQDSQYVPTGHILDGLASKFAREGYTGNIWFVKGGHGAVRAAGLGLIQSGEEEPSTPQIPGYTGPGGAGLMAGGMGRMAFQSSSTGGGGMPSPSTTMSGGSRTPGLQLRLDPFDQQNTMQRSSPTTSKKSSSYRGHSAMGDESTASTLQPANPFFDNIRQNMELSHGGITDRIPLGLPEEIKSRASELPSFLEPLASMSDKDASDVLARQFYQVELDEQKRLQAVMDWHTQDSGAMTNEKQAHQDRGQRSADREEVQRLASWGAAQLSGQRSPDEADGGEYYPFSITAGVERGTKNRYKNIWPYDFSRVRLGSPEDDSDYINASYIQPRGTSRRYIATQGPMDATYRDFWTLVWEQGVQVIAMITKQFEGGSVKCGNYWEDKKYGPIRVHQVSQTGGEDKGQTANAGFDFGMAAATPQTTDTEKAVHIKRTFEVTNDDHPESAPRKITQIQCVSWPDFDVPESADVLLDLISDVDEAFKDIYGSSRNTERQDEPPILVHCSAGVGRTGSFIVVDAILDGLRRERFAPKPRPDGEADAAPRPIASRNSSADSTNPVPSIERSVGIPTPILEEPGAEPAPPKRMSLSHANMIDHQRQSFMQHRGDGPGSASGNSAHSVPTSSGKASYTSSERRAMAKTLADFGVGKDMRATTASKDRGNAATPLSEMEHPVLEVLEGIRVQRMSLVQSLRQFVFVHRAIMTAYIQLIDGKRPTLSHAGSSGPTVLSIPNTSSTDDDTHSKRRASPTELVHDDPMSSFDQSEGSDDPRGASLVKRPSFKKMRPSAVEVITAPSGVSRQMSPKKGGN